MKKICIFTNNRADYNKLEPIINYIHNDNNFELYLIVYGSHLIYDYGNTINMIKYPIYEKINTDSVNRIISNFNDCLCLRG